MLAPEAGTIEFDEGGLGGRVARLHRPGGGYWYYAHLSDWNTKRFSSGDTVDVGDVIGFCGNSGNAKTTAPHVHFGWYDARGKAHDPMRYLIRWLRRAKRRAFGNLGQARTRRARRIDSHVTRRLFGDAFTPDLTALEVSGGSLWASGTNPASGAFGLARSALHAAMAEAAFETSNLRRSTSARALSSGDGRAAGRPRSGGTRRLSSRPRRDARAAKGSGL